MTAPPKVSQNVPFHSLGVSQILSYGCLFYAFAQLKIPLAAKIGVDQSEILAAVTGALLIQAFLAPLIGGWIDKFGALTVMRRGLMIVGCWLWSAAALRIAEGELVAREARSHHDLADDAAEASEANLLRVGGGL